MQLTFHFKSSELTAVSKSSELVSSHLHIFYFKLDMQNEKKKEMEKKRIPK